MAYLNCPSCRLTVYSPTPGPVSEECPRCGSKLGKVSRLFRSSVPGRVGPEKGTSARARTPA